MRDSIWSNIFRLGPSPDGVAGVLRTVPLFQELDARELKRLEGIVHVRTYKPHEPVFGESDPGAGMYVIKSGRVDIVLNHGKPNEIRLAELGPSDFFGEMALLGESVRTAAAVAMEKTELIGFFHPDLTEIINLHPAMGAKITLGLARTLSERLRYTNEQLRGIMDIRGRNESPLQ